MSIFHCLVIDSTISKEATTENPKLYCVRLSILLITSLNVQQLDTAKRKISRTVEPRYNDPRYNDIPGITINMLCPGKSYSKMYGTEPRYNDLRYNDIPDITMSFQRTERKIFPDITILQYQYTDTVAHASSQGDESDSDDDISVIEPTPLGLTPVQATEAVKAIRDFIITLDDSGEREREFLSSLSAMEDAFSRLQIKQMRQTKLEEYFN